MLDLLSKPEIDYIEITLTKAQLIAMPREELQSYEALFRAAFDRGLSVTHWHDSTFFETHYVISREPREDLP